MRIPRIGPGAIVTAAFIGPGTVTTCLRAGVDFRYALLWALVFATAGTIIFQEMAARLGVAGEIGLGEAIRRRFDRQRTAYWFAAVLVVSAIGLGNAAYQTGNLLGAASGLQILGGGRTSWWGAAVGLLASLFLWRGSYRLLERLLVALVITMSVVFIATAIAVVRDTGDLLTGLVVPRLPEGSDLVALALIGTTIVPYNLFLHSNAARERWRGVGRLGEARADLGIAIVLGGLISMSILITGAAQFGTAIDSPAQMARMLEPVLGRWATTFFAIGFFAAGMTSAITAPMAAAYAVSGVLGWVQDLRSPLVRIVWMTVMAIGVGFTLTGVQPVPAILFAQAANAVLLPAIAIFLMIVMNDRRQLKGSTNGVLANVLGTAVVALTMLLSAVAIWRLVTR
ncbi:MAG TPA: Nramp family divalent metal transporter [Gemmatimonadaceae bacterium]|nr:Nramp family divalent metal transporter [Gemmatimonadaceae bacterium]